MNRSGMPNADFSTWTPLSELADQIVKWTYNVETIQNGKIYLVKTSDGVTKYL